MKMPRDTIKNRRIKFYARHFALTFSRENPPIHKLCLFEGRFSLLFAQSIYLSKQIFCAKIQPFPIKNLHGKFYRLRLAKCDFAALYFIILPLCSVAETRRREGVSDEEKCLFTRGAYLDVRDPNKKAL